MPHDAASSALLRRPLATALTALIGLASAAGAGAKTTVYAGTFGPGFRGQGHVFQYVSGTTWIDLHVPNLDAVWDLEQIGDEVWCAGHVGFESHQDTVPHGIAGFVFHWDGLSWTNASPAGGFPHAATSVTALDGRVYATVDGVGLMRWEGGQAWTTIDIFPLAAQTIASDAEVGRPILYIGQDNEDEFWTYDPSGGGSCGSFPGCNEPLFGAVCSADCFHGSCIHAFAEFDDGAGPRIYAGAFEGRMYRTDASGLAFEQRDDVPDPFNPDFNLTNVQGLTVFEGRLWVGISDGKVWSTGDGTAFTYRQEHDFDDSSPVSHMITVRSTGGSGDLGGVWVGFGGVPYRWARRDGISSVRSFDGVSWTTRGLPRAFFDGVPALLAVEDEVPCDAGADVVADCDDGVRLHGDGGGGTPTYHWESSCPGTVFSPSPDVADPLVTFGSSCGVSCDLTLHVDRGNGDTCSDVVHVDVDDSTPPVITGGTIAPCYDTREQAEQAALDATSATDNCTDPVPLTVSSTGTCSAIVTVVATDGCGTQSSRPYPTRIDGEPPVLTCPKDVTIECGQPTDPAATGTATATDNCDGNPTITYSDALNPNGPGCMLERAPRSIFRTWTATDSCGHSSECVQAITVVDTTPPVITCPPNVEVPCGQPTDPAATGTATATDTCDSEPVVTFSDAVAPGRCPQERTISRTWTARDACLNTASCVQDITVVDTIAPVITCPTDVTVQCDAPSDPSGTGTASATDNCDPAPAVTFTDAVAPGRCPQEKRISRTWTATDACSNSASCVQVISIVDTKPPVITCPADATVECDAPSDPSSTGTASATDNCDAAPSVTFADAVAPGRCPQEKRISRTWTATDACSNSASCVQVISVVDTKPPVITCPADATVQCDAPSDPSSTGTASATDNCDAAPSVTFADAVAPGRCPQEKRISRTWTATDACSNSASCVQVISVVDTKPPVITCPKDATVECDAPSDPSSTGTASATDNCDAAPSVTFADAVAPGRCPQEKRISRTWTATDACSNSSSCVQLITVVDTKPPVITCPTDVTVQCDAPSDPSSTGIASATDNCDPAPAVTFADAVAPGRCPQEKRISRTWTATDACSNSASCVQVISVVDTKPPVPSALMQPLAPRSPMSAHSVCSAPTTRTFVATCAARDNCDPAPALVAQVLVTQHDVPVKNGPCVRRVDVVNVSCGEILEVRLIAPPCPAKPPKAPRSSLSVRSDGVKVITGESVVLRVTATDACGNSAHADDDPASHPSPLCDERLIDGTCCPAIAAPPLTDCKKPCAP